MKKFSKELDTAFKQERKRLASEARAKVGKYLLAGFGLVAGLAWNDAIKTLIVEIFPLSRDTILAKFVYALIATGILVIMGVYVVRLLGSSKS